MKKMVLGYVATLMGALLMMVTFASFGDPSPNYLVSATLIAAALTALGVGWYGLSDRDRADERKEAS